MINEISDFIDRVELSTEEIIYDQIYNKKLFVSVEKENFLEDVKRFLYSYCTTGEFYPHSPSQLEGDGEDEADPPHHLNKLKVLRIIHKFK